MRAHEGVRKQEIQWTSKKNKRKVFDNKKQLNTEKNEKNAEGMHKYTSFFFLLKVVSSNNQQHSADLNLP